MTSLRRLYLASVVLVLLWLGQPECFGQNVVGYTAVLQSTNSSEIDGYSATETSYDVAYYYDAGVIGYLYDGTLQVDVKAAEGTGLAEAYPTSTSVHLGDTYTLYSEHYLIAYYYTPGVGFSNPFDYYPGTGFAPGDPGYAPGSSFSPGGGPGVVQESDIYLGYTYLQFSPVPPQVSSISPKSVVRGTSGSFYLQGTNLQDDFGVFTVRVLDGDNISVAWSAQSSASLSYTIAANATEGTHRFTVSNTWGESEPISFTVNSGWPINPCEVSSSPTSGYTSIVPTGTAGDSGTMTVSFSGAAYSAVSQTVSYGPNSTPSSIAASIAALITANYTQYGLTARAFGPNVVYSGKSTVGTVNHVITGTSVTTTTSSAAETAAGMACAAAPPQLPSKCGDLNQDYVLAVHRDSVSWIDDGLNHGREVLYELEGSPTAQYPLGAPALVNSTITEHLDVPMSYGYTSSNAGKISDQFDDILGSTAGPAFQGVYRSGRCFTVTLDQPFGTHIQNLGHVQTLDKVSMHQIDDIKIRNPIPPNKDGVTTLNGSTTSVSLYP